jgi:hypothetical protein
MTRRMMQPDDDNFLPRIAAVARPGDTIMIGFDRTLTDEELDDLREGFEGFTNTTGVHIAFVEHATSMAVARAQGETDDAGTPWGTA